ncbi:MAG: peptidoglycan DD-metalloendopeptidase family protein [Oscillospiraceae bacterium]|jgi:murein DD-endopeptidase MepM/ murein hydrolase activator NlpD|nr:peptidoglycan DD-metalloendopeptidase family protein [Oscillospiraceae bacterium]
MIRKITICVMVLMAMVSTFVFMAPEKETDAAIPSVSAATQAELQAKQKQLAKEQSAIKSKLSSIRKNKASAQEEVDEINKLVANLESQISALNENIDSINDEIAAVEADIKEKEDLIDENYDKFKNRLRAMYMTGDMSGGLEVLLSSEGFDDFLSRMYYVEVMSEHDKAIIDSLTADKEGYVDKKKEIEVKKAEVDAQKTELAVKKTELNEEKKIAEELLAEIAKEQKNLENQQRAVDAKMETAKAQLDQLIGNYVKKDVGSKYVGGSFKWPAPGYGKITSPYGMRWGKLHKGIDIGSPMGAKIIASNTGTVVTSSYNAGGYGNYVIINHGGGYMTVYAHLSKRHVSVGQYVTKGATIGLCGSTGHSTGPHLHFEIRVNGTAVNPRNYV